MVAPHYEALVLVQFADLSKFKEWAGGSTAVRATVSGLGDAAFVGPKAGDEPTVLAFRKGTRGVRLTTTSIGDDGTRVVTMEQLAMMADLISARLE